MQIGEKPRRVGNCSHTEMPCKIKLGPLSGTWYISMRLWRVDAPGRRGRFATLVAKSSDDARAVGAYDGIVSLVLSLLGALCNAEFS